MLGGRAGPSLRVMPAWLVESYWPPATGSPDAVADRIHALAEANVRLVGVVHVPADEMALWRFEARDRAGVESLCAAAGVRFERIVEVVDLVPPMPAAQAGTQVGSD
jgi:hypothetical protein